MSLDTIQALQNLEKTQREAFGENLRRVELERDAWKEKAEQVEQDRDSWKTKCLEQERKIQNLESFLKDVEGQATDLIERNESSCRSKSPTKLELESPVTSSISSISSASTTRTQQLVRSNETLKRKYNNIDNLYREAKRQNSILKTELERRTGLWQKWYEWSLRVKSASPVKQPNSPSQTLEKKEPQTCEADKDITDRQDVMLARNDVQLMSEQEYFRTPFRPDTVSVRRDTQSIVSPETPSIKSRTSIKRTNSSEQLPTSEPDISKSKKATANSSMEEIRQIHDTLEAPELQDLQTTSKPEIIEIDIAESPVPSPHRTSPSKETRAISVERPKSAPTHRSRASDSYILTRTSGKKLKKRDYPNMKFYTEDGTDGINSRAPSPLELDDGGLLMAMLEGAPPEAPGIAAPTSFTIRKQLTNVATLPDLRKSTAKAGRVRELVEIESDSESGEISTPPAPIPKRQKVQSEPRLPRQLLSPDLASRNKGRGRYSSSFLKRNPGDPERLEDFEINPEKNDGVSYAFNEVIRGKEARKNLDATSCANCVKFYRTCAGDVSCNRRGDKHIQRVCKHREDQHIQQVSKHRGKWLPEPVPTQFWNSDFPTDEQLAKEREEAEKRNEERLRQRKEGATRKDGRWKRKNT